MPDWLRLLLMSIGAFAVGILVLRSQGPRAQTQQIDMQSDFVRSIGIGLIVGALIGVALMVQQILD